MNMNRVTILATCLAVGLAAVAEPTLAKKKNKKNAITQTSEYANPASQGYPNGRPWQAMAHDFIEVMNQLDVVDAKVDEVKADTEEILETLDGINEDLDGLEETVDGIAADVASLKNTLQVQVSVAPDGDRNDESDLPVTLFVQVSQNGAGVSGLTADDFGYVNSFPSGDASYCGAACFTAGDGGTYAIVLEGDWEAASYAGSLSVESTVDETTSHGNTLVNFTIPMAPVEPEPL
jgi:hypothetical protein